MQNKQKQNINFDASKIRDLCQKHGIKLLLLHGSYAKGTATAQSDIDIGILYDKRKKPFRGYTEIFSDFGEVFGDKFDPVFLNGAEPLICYQTALHGQSLFQETEHTFADYKVQTIGRYLDTKKFRELEKAYVKRGI
jgi:predicted nucleotidyltransferase